jgi:hypothetical protein
MNYRDTNTGYPPYFTPTQLNAVVTGTTLTDPQANTYVPNGGTVNTRPTPPGTANAATLGLTANLAPIQQTIAITTDNINTTDTIATQFAVPISSLSPFIQNNSIPPGIWDMNIFASCVANKDVGNIGLRYFLLGYNSSTETLTNIVANGSDLEYIINLTTPLPYTLSLLIPTLQLIPAGVDYLIIVVTTRNLNAQSHDASLYFCTADTYSHIHTTFAQTGAQGATGPQGPQGLTGATGVTGPIGVSGATGSTGPQGSTGPAGTGYFASTYAAEVYLPQNQVVPNAADTKINFSNVFANSFDPQGWWKPASNVFQPTIAGYYQVFCDITLSPTAGLTTNQNLQILKNGSQMSINFAQSANLTNYSLTTDVIVYLNGTTDNVYYTVYCTGTQTLQGGTPTRASITLLTAGPQGATGSTGPTGVSGATGSTGPVGVSGATGVTGPVGVSGATGPRGVSGATGPIGVSGATGSTGVIGVTGVNWGNFLYWNNTSSTWALGNANVIIGSGAGQTNQGTHAVAIGFQPGSSGQGSNAVAIGYRAGYTSQASNAIAIGVLAGANQQQSQGIAIGYGAGQTGQKSNAIAIGQDSGQTNQAALSVAVGDYAGQSTQGGGAVAIGFQAGQLTQGTASVAIGYQAGNSTQGQSAVAIGNQAGFITQGDYAVAIGNDAGQTSQNAYSVAIGFLAGSAIQRSNAIAIGSSAGRTNQGTFSVAIGSNAGAVNQGSNSIAIGNGSGATSLAANAIFLNASGFASTPATYGFYASPVRTVANGATGTLYPVLFSTTSNEFSYVGTTALNYVTSTGVLSATAFNTTSDRNSKTSVRDLPLEYCKGLLKKLNPVQYSFKNDTGTTRFGFIAQEIEEVLEGERLGLHYKDPEEKNPQAVGYQELIAPLVKIINDLVARVENLEKM